MSMRIYTRTGDGGETGLFGGQRVAKDDVRVEAYGCVDELNAALGQARAHLANPPQQGLRLFTQLDDALHEVQALLFSMGAVLATPTVPGRPKPAHIPDLEASSVLNLEAHIDRFENELPPLKQFILPTGSHAATALHVARGACRRAERRVVHLARLQPDTDPQVTVLLNRLSDLLFVMARLANRLAGIADVPWQP